MRACTTCIYVCKHAFKYVPNYYTYCIYMKYPFSKSMGIRAGRTTGSTSLLSKFGTKSTVSSFMSCKNQPICICTVVKNMYRYMCQSHPTMFFVPTSNKESYAKLDSFASVYLIAAGGSLSTAIGIHLYTNTHAYFNKTIKDRPEVRLPEPKFPCPATKGCNMTKS